MKSQKEFKASLIQLSEKIYQCRIAQKITAKEMASKLSLTPEAYRNIEKGITDVSFTKLLMISHILQIDWQESI